MWRVARRRWHSSCYPRSRSSFVGCVGCREERKPGPTGPAFFFGGLLLALGAVAPRRFLPAPRLGSLHSLAASQRLLPPHQFGEAVKEPGLRARARGLIQNPQTLSNRNRRA